MASFVRTSFFLIGFYTLSLVCFVLILKFGILPAVNPPSKTLRGMFVLACSVAGIAGGGSAIFFWKAARYGIGAWGGAFPVSLAISSLFTSGAFRLRPWSVDTMLSQWWGHQIRGTSMDHVHWCAFFGPQSSILFMLLALQGLRWLDSFCARYRR